MNQEELKQSVDSIIKLSRDDERAHAEEDELHLELIRQFCPSWVVEEIEKLNKADFARWCA